MAKPETHTLDVPMRTWWRLASIADSRGIRVVELLEQLSLDQVMPAPVTQQRGVRRRLVAELHARGLNDSQIARRLNCTRSNVLIHRRALGLESNFQYGRQVKE